MEKNIWLQTPSMKVHQTTVVTRTGLSSKKFGITVYNTENKRPFMSDEELHDSWLQ